MIRPKVSIGVPVYNGQRYLEQALRSLVDQTHADFELIISDNASTDRTAEICQEFAARDPRIQYYQNATNIGANPNFNRVLDLARGEYFRWAAYDDICEPTYLQRCVAALDADPSAVLAHTKTAIIDENTQRLDTNPDALAAKGISPQDIQDPPRRLDSNCAVRRYTDVLLHTKWCFEIFALFRTDKLRLTGGMGDFYGTDKVILATMALQGTFIEVDETLFLRRHHAAQSSSIKTASQRAIWSGATKSGGMLASQRKCLAGYRRAIGMAPIGFCQKLACHTILLRYLLQVRKWSTALGLSRDHTLPTPPTPAITAPSRKQPVH